MIGAQGGIHPWAKSPIRKYVGAFSTGSKGRTSGSLDGSAVMPKSDGRRP
jgi:hypothetical protein